MKAPFLETPRGAETRDPSAHDYDWELFGSRGLCEGGMVANSMAQGKRVVHESSGDGPRGFCGETDQRGA